MSFHLFSEPGAQLCETRLQSFIHSFPVQVHARKRSGSGCVILFIFFFFLVCSIASEVGDAAELLREPKEVFLRVRDLGICARVGARTRMPRGIRGRVRNELRNECRRTRQLAFAAAGVCERSVAIVCDAAADSPRKQRVPQFGVPTNGFLLVLVQTLRLAPRVRRKARCVRARRLDLDHEKGARRCVRAHECG